MLTTIATVFYQIDATYYIGLAIFGFLTLFTVTMLGIAVHNIFYPGEFAGKNGRIYLIPQGKHSSNNRWPRLYFFRRDKYFAVTRSFRFTPTCFYRFGNENDYDVNKLFGFTTKLTSPMDTSFRFGWNNETGEKTVSIHAFWHIDNAMRSQYMGEVEIEKSYRFRITKGFAFVDFSVIDEDGNTILAHHCPYIMKSKFSFGYRLFPYFGGNEVAPHDILLFD